MQRFRIVSSSVLAFAVLATACIDTPTDTQLAPPLDARFSMTEDEAEFETTGQSLVVFSAQRLPNNAANLVASYGGSVVASYGPIGVIVADGLSDDAVAALAALDEVFAVSPDYILPLWLPDDMDVADAGEIMNDNPQTAFFFARQWHMRAISADAAWAAGHTGSAGVTVAILDTGLDYTNLDLAGLVDLSRSVSFITAPDPALIDANFPGAHPVADLHWHGTHVGATVASNAIVGAGVTSKTTLIGVKVCNRFGQCPTSGVLAGVMYAADAGAHIANMSLGGLFLKGANPGFVAVINRAFTYAYRQGMLIVTSAGNANTDLDRNIHPVAGHVPSLFASYCDAPNVACVSATGPASSASVNGPWGDLDTRAPYSNFGRNAIDVAAPGGRSGAGFVGNGGLVWASCSRFSLQVPICQTGNFIIGSTGTSMASPHAAGVAALIAANGASRPAQIRARLRQSADAIDGGGNSAFFGQGRVNAAKAVGVN
jgi:lantibiotic leader peptide-processing serine protease